MTSIPVAVAVAAPYGPPGPKIAGTSDSVVEITNHGSKVFIVNEYNRSFAPGTRIRATNDDDGNWIEGVCTAFNPSTRELVVTADMADGGGLGDSWHINVAGEPGQVQEAPNDGQLYGRSNSDWIAIDDIIDSGGIPEAPIDGKSYGRRNGAWDWVISQTADLVDGGNF